MVWERQMKLVSKPFFEQQNVVFFSKQEKKIMMSSLEEKKYDSNLFITEICIKHFENVPSIRIT